MTGAYVAYGLPGISRTLAWRLRPLRRARKSPTRRS
jgi:hypothetical protein